MISLPPLVIGALFTVAAPETPASPPVSEGVCVGVWEAVVVDADTGEGVPAAQVELRVEGRERPIRATADDDSLLEARLHEVGEAQLGFSRWRRLRHRAHEATACTVSGVGGDQGPDRSSDVRGESIGDCERERLGEHRLPVEQNDGISR